jgi:outer membrane immunogenic protein
MQRICPATLSVFALLSSANAADMSRADTSKSEGPGSLAGAVWTGCYVGVQGGGASGTAEVKDATWSPANWQKAEPAGWMAGVHAGCDYQAANNIVLGVEGAGAWGDFKGASDPFFSGKAVFRSKTDWLAAATGRLGYASGPWLAYAKGGAAWEGERYGIVESGTDYSANAVRFGWTVGGGVEWAFQQNWSARLEYGYYDFGKVTLDLKDAGGTPERSQISDNMQMGTFGLSYRFGGGSALPLK